jgi:hypothetical protein
MAPEQENPKRQWQITIRKRLVTFSMGAADQPIGRQIIDELHAGYHSNKSEQEQDRMKPVNTLAPVINHFFCRAGSAIGSVIGFQKLPSGRFVLWK